ncbi:MAG: M56 family metallopeptidase [Gemmatimonadota bacterium]|nr:M56 family metallopeptidase [Gemmatimonadota bacterium]
MLCILYVNAVGMCLGLAALLLERALPSMSPRRWVWCVIIPISIVLPGFYRGHHAWSIADAFEQQAARPPLGDVFGTASLTLLDPGWWAQIASYDTSINRLWLTASAVLLLWGLASAWRVSRVLSLSRRLRGDAKWPATVDGVSVVVTDMMGPATVGFWRSRVLVPRWVLALPREQRQYVLRHEEEHRRAHDGRLLFVASLTIILMPWNLAMWWLIRRLCLAVEMDCDNRVVNRLGNPNAYGELLVRVAQAASRGPRLQPALLGGVGTLERRLTVLLAPTPLRHVQRFLLPAVALGLVFVVLSMPHPVLGRGSHAHVTITSGTTTTAPKPHPAWAADVVVHQR